MELEAQATAAEERCAGLEAELEQTKQTLEAARAASDKHVHVSMLPDLSNSCPGLPHSQRCTQQKDAIQDLARATRRTADHAQKRLLMSPSSERTLQSIGAWSDAGVLEDLCPKNVSILSNSRIPH